MGIITFLPFNFFIIYLFFQVNDYDISEYTENKNYYVFDGRVTLFFANNFLMQCRITMKFLHNFFLSHEVFFSSHIMFIDTSTKEFTLANIATSSHGIAFEHLLYYKMVANVY